MKKQVQILHLTLGIVFAWCALNTVQASGPYMVSGSDVPEINGYYIESGTENAKPSFTNGSFFLQYKGCTNKWIIEDNSGCPFYSTIVDGDLPVSEGWHSGGKYSVYFTPPVIVVPENTLGYDKKYFVESVADDGSFTDSIRLAVYFTDNAFTGRKGDDFVADGKVTVSNLPQGLNMEIIKTSDSAMVCKLSGNAGAHAKTDDIDNISISFNDNAFAERNADAINGAVTNDIQLLFHEQYFVIRAEDDPEANGTYNLYGIYNGHPMYKSDEGILFYKGCQYGTKWAVNRYYTSREGDCSYYRTQEDSDLVPEGTWEADDNMTITRSNSLLISNDLFNESGTDDGSIADSAIIEFFQPDGGNAFSGADGDDFIADGKVTVANVPDGLTASLVRLDWASLNFKLTGNAIDHASENSVYDMAIMFNNTAFSQDYESVRNTTMDSLQVFFRLDSFYVDEAKTYPLANGWYQASGTYNGRTQYTNGTYWIWYRSCNGGAMWKLTSSSGGGGCPYYSSSENTFYAPEAGWFYGGRGGSRYNYTEPLSIITSNHVVLDKRFIKESSTVPGTVDDSIMITYLIPADGNKFDGTEGEDFVAAGKASVSNLPDNLTASVTCIDSLNLAFKLDGTAINHLYTDRLNNISLELNNSAFTLGNAADVPGSTYDSLQLIYQIDSVFVSGAITHPYANGWYKEDGFYGKHIVMQSWCKEHSANQRFINILYTTTLHNNIISEDFSASQVVPDFFPNHVSSTFLGQGPHMIFQVLRASA